MTLSLYMLSTYCQFELCKSYAGKSYVWRLKKYNYAHLRRQVDEADIPAGVAKPEQILGIVKSRYGEIE